MSDWAPIRDEIKARLRLSEIVGRKVLWDRRKSSPSRGEFWACCPFHHEKSASFHVLDREGYYKCFGCGAGGDVVNFVMETENRSYREAMEMLAEEAGVELPKPSAHERELAHQRASLHEVIERATKFFEDSLKLSVGSPARDYLKRRGLSADVVKEFRLGYWPDGGHALIDHLKANRVALDQMRAAGLLAQRDDEARDLMRHRLIFPIADGRGRVIAFGGRALRDDQQPKYLNSPDTELFHKGRTLYNFARARTRNASSASPLWEGRSAESGAGGGLADKPSAPSRIDAEITPTRNTARSDLPTRGALHSPLIVAEGYMDVIALHRAGLRAVAPLGTALTEDQLALLWSIEEAPIICFDGDAAGLAAVERALQRALPLLKPGRTLKFALLPPGLDPDDLLNREGAAVIARVIESAIPLAQAYWDFTIARSDLTTPDGRASAEAELLEGIKRIADGSVRRHYEAFIRGGVASWFAPNRSRRAEAPTRKSEWRGAGSDGRFAIAARPTAELRARRGRDASKAQSRAAEEVFVLSLLTHPLVVHDVIEEVGSAALTIGPLMALRDHIVQEVLRGADTSQDLISALDAKGLAGEARRLISRVGLRVLPSANPAAEPELVKAGLKDLIVALAGRQEALEAEGAAKVAVQEGLAKDSWAEAQSKLRVAQRRSGGS